MVNYRHISPTQTCEQRCHRAWSTVALTQMLHTKITAECWTTGKWWVSAHRVSTVICQLPPGSHLITLPEKWALNASWRGKAIYEILKIKKQTAGSSGDKKHFDILFFNITGSTVLIIIMVLPPLRGLTFKEIFILDQDRIGCMWC